MKVMGKMKNEKGITLVVLVAIIAILLIISGLLIFMIIGNNSATQKTNQANNDEGSLIGTGSNTRPTVNNESYANPYIPVGFTHIGTDTWNRGYTIKETATGNEFVWVPCVTVQTAQSTVDGVVTFKKITTGKYNIYNLGVLPTDTTVEEEDSSVNEIKESVGTYGGFYIAKYEAGVIGTKDNHSLSKRTAVDGSVKPLSQSGVGVWNYITRTDAITVSKAMVSTTDGVKSTLISGECWDTTLAWITTVDSTYAEDSKGKGNYTEKIATTGSNTSYAVNNIYDMAGNVYELTTENCTLDGSSDFLVRRGGYYGNLGSDYPTADRFADSDIANSLNGFRPVLYK